MRNTTCSLLLLLSASALTAQTQTIFYVPDSNATTGNNNGFPFGSQGTRTQELILQSSISSVPGFIHDLFVAANVTSAAPGPGLPDVSEVVYSDFEVRMGITTMTTLTTNWVNNSPNAVTVYRGPLRVRFTRGTWCALGLPLSYLWLPTGPGDNLVVDFINWGASDRGQVTANPYYMYVHSGGISRAFLINWAAAQPATAQNVDTAGVKLGILFNSGNFVPHGGGCPGSSTMAPLIGIAPGTWPQLGSPIDVRLSQGPVNFIATLVLGFNTQTLGPFALPYNLAPHGAPGCMVWHDSLALMPFTPTNAAGDGATLVPVPNLVNLSGMRVYGYWMGIDPAANALGLTTSGYATIILGN